MTRQQERDEFVARLTRELPEIPPHVVASVARQLMRAETTLHRLAEAQCNGDWPADNGERKVIECTRCGSLWVPSVLKGKDRACPDCRTQDRVVKLCAEYGFVPQFQGDPRGAVLLLHRPGYDEQDRGIYVP